MMYKIGMLILLLVCGKTQCAKEQNELLKIYHHKTDKNPALLDVGKLCLHFSQEPLMQLLPAREQEAMPQESRVKTAVFFFPKLKVVGAASSWLQSNKEFALHHCTMRFEAVNKPMMGVKLTVTYDPSKIDFTQDTCDSIVTQANGSREKCIVFKFYNKEIINKMQHHIQAQPVTKLTAAPKPAIIIDCGHGGKDYGAVGCFNIKEKDITMNVGLQLASFLRKEGYTVFMTRHDDRTVGLDERTAFAHACAHAQLLVSIHANYSPRKTTSGVETFCLHPTLFSPYYASTTGSQDYIKKYETALHKQSHLLAQSVHETVLAYAKKKQPAIADRKVKHAVSQVLMGATVPATLVELGFVSNLQEAKLLKDREYQRLLAQGICKGIITYFQERMHS